MAKKPENPATEQQNEESPSQSDADSDLDDNESFADEDEEEVALNVPSVHDWGAQLDNEDEAVEIISEFTAFKDLPIGRMRKFITSGAQTFWQYFLGLEQHVAPAAVRQFFSTSQIGKPHVIIDFLNQLVASYKSQTSLNSKQLWNTFRFLRAVGQLCLPDDSQFTRDEICGAFIAAPKGIRVLKRAYQNAWLALIKRKLSDKLLSAVVPFMANSVLDVVPEPHLFADFLFKSYERSPVFGMLALDGLFVLVTKHNFEYPDFYESVYNLATSQICYSEHSHTLLNNVDKFLSSSHVPDYVLAGFVKRLSRLALWAPLNVQERLLALVRNLIVRHRSLICLVHREAPEQLAADPYNPKAPLISCNAINSSIWEVLTLQHHWHPAVSRRAGFVSKKLEKLESVVRARDLNAYFEHAFERKFGEQIDDKSSRYIKSQEGHDYEEENASPQFEEKFPRGNKRKSNFKSPSAAKFRKLDASIAVNENPPLPTFFQYGSSEFESVLVA